MRAMSSLIVNSSLAAILSLSSSAGAVDCGFIGRILGRARQIQGPVVRHEPVLSREPNVGAGAGGVQPASPRSPIAINGNISDEQRFFREAYNSGTFSENDRYISFLNPETGVRDSARIRSINPDGSLDVEAYIDGKFGNYLLAEKELLSARVSQTARRNFANRPEAHNDGIMVPGSVRSGESGFDQRVAERPQLEVTAKTPQREAAFRRSYNEGKVDDETRFVSFEAPRLVRDMRIAARIERINPDGTVDLVYNTEQGHQLTARLTREEAMSIRISDTAREAFGSSASVRVSASSGSSPSYVREIFGGARGYNGGIDDVARARFSKGVASPNGRMDMTFEVADREYARAQGRIFENARPSQLPQNQRYTWVVLEDGSTIFGQIVDGAEFGVKHLHLAAGRNVVAAGELAVTADGAVYNLLSGTYTDKMLRRGLTTPEQMREQVGQMFRNDFRRVEYTDSDLLYSGQLSAQDLRRLCGSQIFRRNNSHYCH